MSLRNRMFAILLVALVPTLLVFVWFSAVQRSGSEARLHAEQRARVELQRMMIEQILLDIRSELDVIAHSSGTQREDRSEMAALVAEVARMRPEYRYVGVTDASGTVWAASVPVGDRSVADREWFRRLVRSGEPAIGSYEHGVLARNASLPVAVPMIASDGSLRGVVFADYLLTSFSQRLNEIPASPDTVSCIMDRDGSLIAHLPPLKDHPIGSPRSESEAARVALTRPADTVSAEGLDGVERRYDFAVVEVDADSPVYVAVGHNESSVYHPERRDMLLGMALLFGVVGIEATVAFAGVERWVLAPVGRLHDASRRLAAGELSARAGDQPTPEFSDLAAQFDRMAGHIEREFLQQQRRSKRVETLHGVMEAAVSSTELEVSAQNVLDFIVERGGFDLAEARLARSGRLELIASSGYPEGYRFRYHSLPLPSAEDTFSVFVTGQRMVAEDAVEVNAGLVEAHRCFDLELGSYIVLPLASRDRTVGTVMLGWHRRRHIDPRDVDFYQSLAAEVGVVLENAHVYGTERHIANTLQEALLALPRKLPGVVWAHSYRAAQEAARVGGDFYDLFELPGHRIGIVIGDVAGKGVEAAVLTSVVKNTIRAHAAEPGKTPSRVLELTNEVALHTMALESFATVFFGVLDCHDGRFVYANAGHCPAVVIRREAVSLLPPTGTVVGALDDVEFEEAETSLGDSDVLFLYTDGLTEARHDGDFYGEDRLVGLVAGLKEPNPESVLSAVTESVMDFAHHALTDDLAMLALQPVPGKCGHYRQQKLDLA